MKISVVTPTYNRAYTLYKLYNSLLENKKYYTNFEWVIIDDGSTDDTYTLVQTWIEDGCIDIKYYHQKNGGKMMALNNVMKYIDSDLIIEVDSDDYLVDDAFRTINEDYQKIKDLKSICGIIYLRKLTDKVDNKINCPKQYATLYDLNYIYDYDSDTTLVFKTDIRKKYYHKLEKNENFITEARMYNEIGEKYDFYIVNKEIIVCEYLEDGYTKNILDQFKKYPFGYLEYYKEIIKLMHKGITFKKKMHIYKHYILFNYLAGKTKKDCIDGISGIKNKIIVSFLVLPGYIKSKEAFTK